jgi:hypothetical protein
MFIAGANYEQFILDTGKTPLADVDKFVENLRLAFCPVKMPKDILMNLIQHEYYFRA